MFRAIPGVLDAVCVYVGGKAPWPTYECIHDYTEGVTVVFDPDVLSIEELLEIFLGKVSFTHCPSSTQYMSIFAAHCRSGKCRPNQAPRNGG